MQLFHDNKKRVGILSMTNLCLEQNDHTYTFSLMLQTCIMMLHFIITKFLNYLLK